MSVLDVKTFKKGQRSSGRNLASNLEKKSQSYSKRMTQIWNCIDVEMDQSESSIKRRVRELIFDNVYESEMALRQQNPIRVTANNIKVRNKITPTQRRSNVELETAQNFHKKNLDEINLFCDFIESWFSRFFNLNK